MIEKFGLSVLEYDVAGKRYTPAKHIWNSWASNPRHYVVLRPIQKGISRVDEK